MVSYFPDGWRESAEFEGLMEKEAETMREVRCCLNSEQCDLSKKRQEEVDCSKYTGELSNERALMGAELFVVRKRLSGRRCAWRRLRRCFIKVLRIFKACSETSLHANCTH